MGNPASPLSARASSGHCVTPSPYSRCTVAAPGTEEAPEVFLLEDVALDVPGGGDTVSHALSEHNLERKTLAAITHSPHLGVQLQVDLATRLNTALVTLELCRGPTQPALPRDHLVGHHVIFSIWLKFTILSNTTERVRIDNTDSK